MKSSAAEEACAVRGAAPPLSASGTVIGKTSAFISARPDFVDIVCAGRGMNPVRKHQGESEDTESDHDGCEDQRLRDRIGKRFSDRLSPSGMIGARARVNPPAVKINRFVPLLRSPDR